MLFQKNNYIEPWRVRKKYSGRITTYVHYTYQEFQTLLKCLKYVHSCKERLYFCVAVAFCHSWRTEQGGSHILHWVLFVPPCRNRPSRFHRKKNRKNEGGISARTLDPMQDFICKLGMKPHTVKSQVLTCVTNWKNIFCQKVTVHKHQKSPS